MRMLLRISGILTAVIYVAMAALSAWFTDASVPSERPILAVLALLAIACILYLASLALIASPARRLGKAAPEHDNQPRVFRDVLLFSIVFRLVLLFSVPIQEVDFYRYLWDGRVVWQGLNPYRFAPAQIDDAEAGRPAELSDFAAVRDSSSSVRGIFDRVHHRQVPTIYPPLAQAFFALCAAITSAAAPIWVHVSVLRGLLILVDVAILYSMRGLLRQVGMSDGWCMAYGWCPLAIKEVANSAHVDGLAVLFTLVALQLVLKAARTQPGELGLQATWAMAGGSLGLAILAKTYPIILLPLLASFAIARIRARAVIPLLVCAAVVTAGYLPFVAFKSKPETANQRTAEGESPWSGLGTFLTRWQMNDLLFMVVHENLRIPPYETGRWFVVTPGRFREAVNRQAVAFLQQSPSGSGADPAFIVTQIVIGALLLSIVGCCAWRVFAKPEPINLLRGCFMTLAWAWLLNSTQNPWYVLWFLPLMPFARARSWFLVPCLSLAYYLRFWLISQGNWSPATGECPAFDYGWVWVEHGLVLVALAAESCMRRGVRYCGVAGSGELSEPSGLSPGASDG